VRVESGAGGCEEIGWEGARVIGIGLTEFGDAVLTRSASFLAGVGRGSSL